MTDIIEEPYKILFSSTTNLAQLQQTYHTFTGVLSGFVTAAFYWEKQFLETVTKLHQMLAVLPTLRSELFPRLRHSRIFLENELESRVDVRNIDNLRVVRRAGKKGKGKKKGGGDEEAKRKAAAEEAAKRKAEEEERMRKWEEEWDRKMKDRDAAEEARHEMCCMSEGLCLKPRTQSNIWINLTQQKTFQDVQFVFKHVPVPKPKPPPLPKLEQPLEPPEKPSEESTGGKKKEKKKSKKK